MKTPHIWSLSLFSSQVFFQQTFLYKLAKVDSVKLAYSVSSLVVAQEVSGKEAFSELLVLKVRLVFSIVEGERVLEFHSVSLFAPRKLVC
jgi:hypothetical protein